MKKHKVLIIPNAEITKVNEDYTVEKNTGEFAKELQNLGSEVTIYGQIMDEPNNIHVYKLNENGLKVRGLYRKSNKILNYILLYLRVIPEIAKSDFVYIFYPTAFKYIAFICNILGRKYGLYVRGADDMQGKIPSLIYKKAAVAFCVADYFTDNINAVVGKKIAYTMRPMITLTEKDIVENRLYMKKDVYKVLYLGRMTNDKGIIELLNAVSELRYLQHKLYVDLVGDGEYFEELKQLANDLDINDMVSFKGATFDAQEIRSYFVNSDIYILPSYHEGFPRTLYEAMIYGTPIITTFVGGIPSLMKDGRNCLEIESKSVESIVLSLKKIFDNYDQFSLFAKEATKTVSNLLETRKYSHAMDVNRYLNNLQKK
ncbi:glycosyltransferase [Chryseobacterium sp. BIGb0232]|uniref:glycosyltransferase n=1 Tax=Chryseobacterium sp. BIGb0232 TaxID=2940598 RepID=UPI000F48896D|nr:glycosyltransferase [Chryseobacterium sp. BIGb0232]MCS4301641.1 glycosyltransferase involved in cell wall biosynthesis [Chryseobacterium sp. BIGb0232]ROS19505.1 glycosyltransferase involved in cell wall biosynthesis [Chryseobacterium nakagawai]